MVLLCGSATPGTAAMRRAERLRLDLRPGTHPGGLSPRRPLASVRAAYVRGDRQRLDRTSEGDPKALVSGIVPPAEDKGPLTPAPDRPAIDELELGGGAWPSIALALGDGRRSAQFLLRPCNRSKNANDCWRRSGPEALRIHSSCRSSSGGYSIIRELGRGGFRGCLPG